MNSHGSKIFCLWSSMAHGTACAVIWVMWLAGCTSYRTPAAAADFHALGITAEQVDEQTDIGIARRLERKPLAGFPANVAIVRVQGIGHHHEHRGYSHANGGRYAIITTRDVETDEAYGRLQQLPMVQGIATLNRLVLPDRLETEEDLRKAAATVQADMLLLYTFETQFETEKKVQPLGLITLGLFPDRVARVTSTASAALVDTRNGYVYALAEGSAERQRLSNAWNDRDALDQSRREAERDAFHKLITSFESAWSDVVDRYAHPESGAASQG